MDGLPRLGWSDTLHCGNIFHFHTQHIAGVDTASLYGGQGRNGFIQSPYQFFVFGYPAFVLCLLDAKARVFAIRSCKSNEPKGFKFSKPRGEQKGVVTISNKNLLDPLRAVTGEDWIPGKRYRVRGFWVADAKTMCFDLNEGVQEDFRPVTPSNDAE